MLLITGMQARAVKRPHSNAPLQTEKVVSSFRDYVETIPYLK